MSYYNTSNSLGAAGTGVPTKAQYDALNKKCSGWANRGKCTDAEMDTMLRYEEAEGDAFTASLLKVFLVAGVGFYAYSALTSKRK